MTSTLELLEDFEEDLSRRFPDQFLSNCEPFTCPVCMFVSKDSITTKHCSHFFCRLCIMRWIRQESCCPICRKSLAITDIQDLEPSQQETLSNLILKCDFSHEGCTWQGPLKDLLCHLNSCQVAQSHGYAPPVLDHEPNAFCKGDRVRVRVTVRSTRGSVVPGDSGLVVGIEPEHRPEPQAICNFPAQNEAKLPFSDLVLHPPKLHPFDLCRIRPVVTDLIGGWRNLTSEMIGVVRSSRFGSVANIPSESTEVVGIPEAFAVIVDFAENGIHKLDSRQLMMVPRRLEVQDRVKVRDDVQEPLYKWGRLHRSEVGSIIEVQRRDFGDSVYIDFPSHKRWHGVSYDLQLLPPLLSENSRVSLRTDIIKPLHELPEGIDSSKTGVVKSLDPNGETVLVKFAASGNDSVTIDDDDMGIEVTLAAGDVASATTIFNIGDLVRVKSGLESVRYGWGNISQNEVGVVVKRDGMELRVDFPSQRNWHAWAPDMEHAKSALRVGNVVKIKESSRHLPVFSDLSGTDLIGRVVELERDDAFINFNLGPNRFKAPSVLFERIPPRFKLGSRVQLALDCVNPSYGYGRARRTEVGVIKRVLECGDLLIDFPNHPDFRSTNLEVELAPHAFRVGDRVRVKPSVSEPKYKFGNVSHSDIGTVKRVDGNFLRIDFENHRNWAGYAPDLELAEGDSGRDGILRVGSKVAIKPDVELAFGNPPNRSEIGSIVDVSGQNCVVDFPSAEGFLVLMDDLLIVREEGTEPTMMEPSQPYAVGFHVGQRVKVKDDIETPRYRWGSVKRGDVGTIRTIEDDGTAFVDFPTQSRWRAALEEMELVDAPPPEPTGPVPIVPDSEAIPAGERGLLPRVGDHVKVKSSVSQPTFQWGNVRPGDIGKLVSVNIESSECRVDFPQHKGWHAKLEELEKVSESEAETAESVVHTSSAKLGIGDLVRVKPDISNPRFRWGNVTHSSIGIVTRVEEAKCKVDFENHRNWAALCAELEVVPWTFAVGDLVRIRPEVHNPHFDWQGIVPSLPGIVEAADESTPQTVVCRFAGVDSPVRFLNSELQLIPPSFRVGDWVRIRPNHNFSLFGMDHELVEILKANPAEVISVDHDVVLVQVEGREYRLYSFELIKSSPGSSSPDSTGGGSHQCIIS
ncbi:hypothetical protein P9112_008732 [Eukaryota sp. TZLM1-RC]